MVWSRRLCIFCAKSGTHRCNSCYGGYLYGNGNGLGRLYGHCRYGGIGNELRGWQFSGAYLFHYQKQQYHAYR